LTFLGMKMKIFTDNLMAVIVTMAIHVKS